MPGKIFFRERRKVEEGEKKPRFNIVAIADLNLKVHVKHMRKKELEQLAEAVGAELIEMKVEEKGHKAKTAE